MGSECQLPTLRQKIFLIGDIDNQILGNKLPSKLQVLKVLFFNIREVKLSVRAAATVVIKEVLIFWEKARLPTRQVHRCIDKLTDLYKEWRILQKNSGRASNIPKEQAFVSGFHNLFDISHGNIDQLIDDVRREFLNSQRLPGRVGYIRNIKTFYDKQEAAKLESEEKVSKRLRKSHRKKNLLSQVAEWESSEEGTLNELSPKSAGSYSSIFFDDLNAYFSESDHGGAGPSTAKRSRDLVVE